MTRFSPIFFLLYSKRLTSDIRYDSHFDPFVYIFSLFELEHNQMYRLHRAVVYGVRVAAIKCVML